MIWAQRENGRIYWLCHPYLRRNGFMRKGLYMCQVFSVLARTLPDFSPITSLHLITLIVTTPCGVPLLLSLQKWEFQLWECFSLWAQLYQVTSSTHALPTHINLTVVQRAATSMAVEPKTDGRSRMTKYQSYNPNRRPFVSKWKWISFNNKIKQCLNLTN